MNRISILPSLSPMVALLIIAGHSHAAQLDTQTQPEEVIRATPLTAFSDRSESWPSYEHNVDASEARSLSEILNSVPGLQSREQGSPTISIRGSASSDRVLSLLEGVPLNFADGLGASRLFIPDEAVGTLRVFKGPASIYYGSSAMAGAVDHRLREFDRPSMRLSLFDQGGQLGAKQIFAGMPVNSVDGQITAFHSSDPGRFPYTTQGRSSVRNFNLTETSRLTARARKKYSSTTVRPLIVAAKSVGEYPGSLSLSYPSTYSNEGLLASVETTTALGNGSQASFRASDVRQWGLFDRGTTAESMSRASRSQLSGDLRASLSQNIVSRTFVDVRHDTLAATYLADQVLQQSETEIGEAIELALSRSLSLTPGFRLDPATGTLIKALAVNFTREFDRQWILYSEGFRRPSLSDRFALTSYFQGNRDLTAERSQTFEVGAEFATERWSAKASLFAVRYNDLFDSRPLTPAKTTKINAGRARADGGELSLSSHIAKFDLRAATSVLEARNEETGEPLTLSPKNQSVLSVSRTSGNWTQEALITRWSPFYDRAPATGGLVELGGWTTFDLGVRRSVGNEWEFKFGILNLFDEPRQLTLDYPEPQRRIYLSASYPRTGSSLWK